MTSAPRIILLVAALPLVAALASIVTLVVLAPQLPTQLAVHWGVNGVDRVDGLGAFIWLVAGLVPAFTAFMLVAALLALRAGTTRSYLRLLVGSSVWFGVLISGGTLGSVLAQRDAPDATAVPVTAALLPLLLAAVAGILLAALLALLVPAVPEPPRGAPVAVAGIPLAPSEAVHWSATVHSPRSVYAVLAAVLLLVVVMFAVAGVPWWLSVLAFVMLFGLGSMLGWHIVVDRRGLRATGLFGYPRIAVSAESVLSTSVVEVRGLREFGGWGLRVDARGRVGLIVRSGPAIQVERVGKQPLVITVPDAVAGAAVLASVAAPRA